MDSRRPSHPYSCTLYRFTLESNRARNTGREIKRATEIIGELHGQWGINDEPGSEKRWEMGTLVMYGMVTQGSYRPRATQSLMDLWQVRNCIDHLPPELADMEEGS